MTEKGKKREKTIDCVGNYMSFFFVLDILVRAHCLVISIIFREERQKWTYV